MPEFSYEALNEADEVTSGRVSAENVSAAVDNLEAQGLRVTSIQQIALESASSHSPPDSAATSGTTASDDQQALRQRIAEVLEKRDVLVPALTAFAEELPRGRSRRVLRHLVSRLRAGADVEELCKTDDRTASWLLLLGGEGRSHRMLSDLFAEASHEHDSRTQWMRALVYPLFVLLAALGVVVFLCIAVVPTFKSTFDEFGLDLPALTLGIIRFSEMILHLPIRLGLAVLAGGATLYLLFRLVGAWGLPGRMWNALATGNSRQVTAAARFSRRLAEALDAGLTLPTALRLAGRAEGRGTTRHSALKLADDMAQKHFNLRESPWARRLPATVVHALQAGHDGRPSIPLLRQLAELYTARVRERCDWSTGFIAQFAIVVMGLAVGSVVLAILLPLVQMINNLTG